MRIGVNCGHTLSGTVGAGAMGILNESVETRAVGYSLMGILRGYGYEVVDCTNDRANSVSENLREICELANAQPLDMFISIHFNAGGGEGCEAYTYGGINVASADEVLERLSSLGFRNRGIKDGSNLYVVRNTDAPAVLLEVCFVDKKTDADLYTSLGAERIADAIGSGISDNKEEISVAQYEELKALLEGLTDKTEALEESVTQLANPMIYNYIDDNMPEWARPTIQKLVDREILKGDEGGLNLTEEMLRLLVINDRAGLFD